MSVDNRLQKIAGTVRRGDRIADIGTDHAYLPVFLVKNGITNKVYACDVADGPLENAKATVEASGLDGIEIRKGDGLDAVKSYEVDTVTVAGMGGDLIARILTAAPWIKNPHYELILQPMTAVEDLREYLLSNGFSVVSEQAVKAQGRIYTVIKAVYTGVVAECNPVFYYFGRLTDSIGEDELVYINRKRRIIKDLAEDIKSIDSQKEKYKRLICAISGIDKILENRNGN